jgi:hypothetical protein
VVICLLAGMLVSRGNLFTSMNADKSW